MTPEMTRPASKLAPGTGRHPTQGELWKRDCKHRQKELKQQAIAILPLEWRVSALTGNESMYPIFLNAAVGPFHIHVTVGSERDFDPQIWYFRRRKKQGVTGLRRHELLAGAIEAIVLHLQANAKTYMDQILRSVLFELDHPVDLGQGEEGDEEDTYDYARDDLNFDAWRERR